MRTQIPQVALGHVLIQDTRYVTELEPREYSKLSVKLYGKGVVLDSPTDGATVLMKRHQIAREGQVIVSEIWAKKGAVGIVPPQGDGALVTSHFYLFDVDSQRAFPGFVGWLFRANYLESQLDEKARGTTGYAAVRAKQFLSLQIPLPSLSEQKRIVARIEELAGKIEEATGLRRKTRDETDAILESQIGAVLHEGSKKAVQSCLGELATKIGSGSTPRGGRSVYSESGIPFIRSLNVRMRRFEYDGIAYINPTIHSAMAGTKVRGGDVLLNITGASIGRVTCVPYGMVEGNVSQHVSIIRTKETLIPRFLMYWLSQPAIQNEIGVSQKGATREAITKAQIENFRVPVLRLADQRRIVAYLDDLQSKVDALKKLQAETSAELDALLSSILDKAFKGEL